MASISRPLPGIARIPVVGPRLRFRTVAAGAAALLVLASLWQVLQTSDATTTGFAIQRLERQREALQAEVHNLEADVAELSSLDRIDREARERLGLVPPARTVYLKLDRPVPERQGIPTRYQPAPVDDVAPEPPREPWWRGALRALLPFY
ncbi:MAG TPA: septum formation initiator family protein [Dehalococcoidia bacterium]|nr:septum formation initiator family protein [Dehalococcoidia bacterium]